MVLPLAVPLALTAAPIAAQALGLGGKKKSTVNQIPLEPQGVTDARGGLLSFAQGGNYGGYKAGQAYTNPFGDYNMTDIEGAGQSKLLAMLQGGLPDIFNTGVNELNSLFTTNEYDPFAENGLYKGFRENLDLETNDQVDALKRDAAFGKSLYSTDTIKRIGDLHESANRAKTGKMAELYDTFVGRRLNAIPQAIAAGQTQEGLDMNRIGASQTYGSLQRTLNDAGFKAAYADFLRRQTEKGGQIGALQSVVGSPPNYGVPSVSIPQDGSFDKVLAALGSIGGDALGRMWGAQQGATANTSLFGTVGVAGY